MWNNVSLKDGSGRREQPILFFTCQSVVLGTSVSVVGSGWGQGLRFETAHSTEAPIKTNVEKTKKPKKQSQASSMKNTNEVEQRGAEKTDVHAPV